MKLDDLVELVMNFTSDTAKANNMTPADCIASMLAAGVASAFLYADKSVDRHEIASDLVGFVNSTCTNVIEGLDDEAEAASNG